MSMKEAVKSVFSQYATFTGRARRSEFWFFWLFVNIIDIAFLSIVASSMLFERTSLFSIICSAVYRLLRLAILLPGLAVCWRRLHDIGKSGAYWFLSFIPLVGAILLLVWFCQDSQPGENQYGPNPKENPVQW